jgi:PPIC-type PPIASE domain
MIETTESIDNLVLPTISPLTETELIAYLRHSYRYAEVCALAERDLLILRLCEQLNLTLSEEELQAAGDAFRLEHRLFGISETTAWLTQQRIALEDWSEGIKISLLSKKLKDRLFGANLDIHYISNRDNYRRVALSQILVLEQPEALKIVQALQERHESFCALALQYSKGKRSQENGGFVGVRFLTELPPDLARAIAGAAEGEVIGPIQTKLGYHILRVEQWFPAELNESVRDQILEYLFQNFLQTQRSQNSEDLRP